MTKKNFIFCCNEQNNSNSNFEKKQLSVCLSFAYNKAKLKT
jgi:hypothetical protein